MGKTGRVEDSDGETDLDERRANSADKEETRADAKSRAWRASWSSEIKEEVERRVGGEDCSRIKQREKRKTLDSDAPNPVAIAVSYTMSRVAEN